LINAVNEINNNHVEPTFDNACLHTELLAAQPVGEESMPCCIDLHAAAIIEPLQPRHQDT